MGKTLVEALLLVLYNCVNSTGQRIIIAVVAKQ